MSVVSLVQGDDRYKNIKKALDKIKEEIKKKIQGKQKILIKPNFVSTQRQLAATHKEAVRAILDFLKELTSQKIVIAEGAALGETDEGFRNFGFYEFQKEYNVEFRDLNKDDFVKVKLYDKNLKPLEFKVARTVIESDFRISSALLKTHDSVIVTLTLKNIAVGALLNKSDIHQGPKAINLNLAKLAEILHPHLAVVDGLVGMEGEGPVHGDPVEMNLAIAGTDFLAVDALGAYLMGFNPFDVGYIYHCWKKKLGEADVSKIKIVGAENIEKLRKKFKPHSTLKEQLKWKDW